MRLHKVVLPAVLAVVSGAGGAAPATTPGPTAASATSVPSTAPASTTSPALATLRQQAATGDAKAEVVLGERLMRSKDAADKTEAVGWYRKAAAQGNKDAEWDLGFAYVMGTGVTRDVATGTTLLRQSLVGGSADHMLIYGTMDVFLGGSPADGAQWIKRSAEAGSTKGMLFWAMLESHGDNKWGVAKNVADGRQWMLKAANLGDVDAETIVGQFYMHGKSGFTQSVATGLQWLHKAAEQGYPRAQGLLGALLVSGHDQVPRNPVEGVQWAEKAAAKHDVFGYYALGLAYQQGVGGKPVDPGQAWYNFAAAQRVDVKHELSKVAVHLSQVGRDLSTTQLDELQAKVSKIPLPKKNHQS